MSEEIAEADICLGGPFGNTLQAQRVITGKTFQFLRSGKPTVIGEIKEDTGFVDKQNCLLVSQGSAKSLADAINWGMANRDKLHDIGKSGRAIYDKKFSVSAQKKEIRDLIGSLTA